uniref:Caspase family p20 domain-containing protein n=1 Tax=Electrophorus electricus TaxID=8005 RepID=A0A4W4G9U9_ELEEL
MKTNHCFSMCSSCRYSSTDRGLYSCRVYNQYHEIWSDNVQVEIGPGSCTDASWKTVEEATDKVALLIGNMNYLHHRQLKAPMADVYELTNLLRQLDFKVVSLLDLNWHEMHRAVSEFLLLLGRGVYGLLYYAGHGYENYGNSFMVPIDAPASYTSEHCLWVQDVLQRMQERQTGLNVFLLDMCRKRNLNDNIIQQPGPLKVTANIVFGYATCVDAEAFEVYKDDLSNGIFMSFLKKRLMEQEKVTVVLDRVAEDMGRCELTRGRQALELRSNLSERRALTDPIQAPDCPVMASTRNLQWAIAHVLPESRVLHFDCGVKVQLGFAAEFSNIMIIYTRILKKPKGICCSAQLSDITEGPETDLKHTNQESLRDAGSLLLSMDDWLPQEQPRLYTRLSALQRLKRDLSFTVCLHYQYSSLDEEVQERQTVTVGKPLVSKLNLHERLLLHTPSSPSASAEFHMHSMPESFAEEMMAELPSLESSMTESTESYDNTQGVFSSSSGAKRNEPEENISPEFLMLKEPIVSKSLSHADADKPFKFSNFHSF